MSEHWKSTPKYWCKHCSCYVRDTKLEKQNHEATARHQGALKRSLRNLHYAHEREERDKARAQQEIARLNGVVSYSSGARAATNAALIKPAAPTESELKKQREQLAELGVAIPSSFRPEMAIAGEWTVTSSRVVASEGEEGSTKTETVATGVRKREEATEEHKEEEEVLERLFKKPRRWGRDSKMMAQGEDPELDALLSGTTIPLKKRPSDGDGVFKEEKAADDGTQVKREEGQDTRVDGVKADGVPIKQEVDTQAGQGLALGANTAGTDGGTVPVVFKKRKAKGIRTK
ncbi:U1 zinc finger protein [Hirsutella rhossiliensis]|uniref:U1 zinc finger protein n=1 Tax=Hirsutella rhossiliensis TaxID=111463 RepID=A0A9P8MJM4_9HYPO|nr:U1 zinc finger protein [Hirsutella rhossiliensis]KAH0957568.1 U1 zinc finger protein [Hirsutella rhossiliensis]